MSKFSPRIMLILVSLVAYLGLLIPAPALAVTGAATCPCGPIGTPVVKCHFFDSKGGLWALICTNSSTTGDFVWLYQAAPGAPIKPLGRCVFVDGQNSSHIIHKAGGNVGYFVHIVEDGGADDGEPWDTVINIFCKNECIKIRICVNFNQKTSRWEESVPTQRQTVLAADFDALDPTDGNGDTVPDEGFNLLTEGLYSFPPPPLPAEFETRVELESALVGEVREVSWIIGNLQPRLEPGDVVEIRDVDMDDVIGHDSENFLLQPSKVGIELVAITTVVVEPFQPLVQLQPKPFGSPKVLWSIVDVSASAFWSGFLAQHQADPNVPIQDILGGLSNDPNFLDMEGYGGSMGEMDLNGIPPIPAVSEWGLIVMTVLVLTAGTIVFGWRRRRTVA